MSYRFNGYFARPPVARPAILPEGAVWRDITAPFVGVGVRICVTGLGDDNPGPEEARQLLADHGLGGATDWVYLSYVTWSGRLDSVYGLGTTGGREFGPVSVWDVESALAAYIELMGVFGVSEADALNFPPFARGFWGE